jgi:hypothetical protein
MHMSRCVGAAVCRGLVLGPLLLVLVMMATRTASAQYPSAPQIAKDGTAIVLQDYASLPPSSVTTGSYPPPINFRGQLGRVNFLRSEPTNAPQGSSRFFVNDLNAHLYILAKATKTFTSYINFALVFPKFDSYPGYAGGLVTFVFDPDYASNGKFYTVHTEDPAKSGSALPTNTNLPGLDLSGGYTTTETVVPPAGPVVREAVLVEWTDTNVNDSMFEGTAREILRVAFDSDIHPMGDLLFNPLAVSVQSDYGNLYIAVGDGSAGEIAGATHAIPQRLDAIQGKILRITPDINRNPLDPLSANGRYRIPATGADPNPFVSVSGAMREIYAYGFRNPHRLSWDPVSNTVIVNDIGLDSWEEVDIVIKGANYGYAEREGIEQLFVGGANDAKTGSRTTPPTPFPSPDTLLVGGVPTPVTPVYPVAEYSHRDGDAISGGFVYRGALMPHLYDKYVFGDITTGRLFYADLTDMIASNDGIRTTLAAVHELQVIYNSPYDSPDRGAVDRRLYDIVADAYVQKGGLPNAPNVLPGGASNVGSGVLDPYGVPYGGGRADIRMAIGGDNEIYILSKSDGMIRELRAPGSVPSAATPAISPVTGTYPSPLTVTITDTTPGATIYYTTNGTTPIVTPSDSYSMPFSLSASATVNAMAVASGYSTSTMASAVYTVTAGAGCLQNNSSSWQNTAISTQGVPFQASFDATPNLANMDGVTGLSLGSGATYMSLAAIVRFNPSGFIDARNGGLYAATTNVPYRAGFSYHFRLQIYPAAHTYTIFVTPPGSAEITLGTAFAFRSEQSGVSSLNNWAMHSEVGSQTVCNFAVAALSLPAPVVSGVNPASGTQGQTLNVMIAGSNFQNGAACSFGAEIAVNSCTVNSSAQITSTITIIGSAATGPRGITVTNPGGQFATLANAFTVSAAPLPPPARAAYSFNAGTGLTAADLSGNSNHGTLQNGVAWTAAGKYGNALNFDGINDFVRVPDSSSLDVGASGTIAAWVRLDAINRWNSVLAKGNVNSRSATNYGLEVTNTNRFFCILGRGSSSRTLTSSITVTTGTFYHVACVWNGTQLRLYINGVLNTSVAQNLTPAVNTSPLYIGQFGGGVNRMRGVIDQVRIYGRALSQAEVSTDMNTPIAP